jgi:hypothetical protein
MAFSLMWRHLIAVSPLLAALISAVDNLATACSVLAGAAYDMRAQAGEALPEYAAAHPLATATVGINVKHDELITARADLLAAVGDGIQVDIPPDVSPPILHIVAAGEALVGAAKELSAAQEAIARTAMPNQHAKVALLVDAVTKLKLAASPLAAAVKPTPAVANALANIANVAAPTDATLAAVLETINGLCSPSGGHVRSFATASTPRTVCLRQAG